MLIQPDGKIVVGGCASSATTDSDIDLVRFGADGQPKASFGPADQGYTTPIGTGAGQDHSHALALQADGKLLLAGAVRSPTARSTRALAAAAS